MADKLVIIYRATESHHAHLLRNLLNDYEIEATVTGDALLNAGAEFAHSGGFPVSVQRSDEALARQIADSFERHVLNAPRSEEGDDIPNPPWQDWPICPQCRSRQVAICCHCGECRDDFALAEWQGVRDDENDVLLVCTTCDDVFVPQFYRDCPWCGFHFGVGLEPQSPTERINVRLAWGVFLGLVAAAGYLWLLYQ